MSGRKSKTGGGNRNPGERALGFGLIGSTYKLCNSCSWNVYRVFMYIFNTMYSAAQQPLSGKKPVVAKPVVAKSLCLSIQSSENHLGIFFFLRVEEF